MIDFKVDKNLCIKCGSCAADCVSQVIKMNEYPEVAPGVDCLHCQHCLAICPSGAVSVLGLNPANSRHLARNCNHDGLRSLIMGRRAVRSFRDEDISEDMLRDILDTAAYAPTGVNASTVCFHVVAGRQAMASFRDKMYQAIAEFFVNPPEKLDRRGIFLKSILNGWQERGYDRLLCHAPYLVVTSNAPGAVTVAEDGPIALSYLELYAVSLGLGTLWNGMMMWLLHDFTPSLRQDLGIPDEHSLGYAMVFGRTDLRYCRSTQRSARTIFYQHR